MEITKLIKKTLKMKDVKDFLIITSILCSFTLIITLKLGGVGIIADPSVVEKIGFCKNTYGEKFHLKESLLPTNQCYLFTNSSINHTFSNLEFREACPKHTLLNWRFYSKCFSDGGSRMNN